MNLSYIDISEFNRIRKLGLDSYDLCCIMADMSRYNTLYMIKNAGSGHIGSSFSALDILTYLHVADKNVNSSKLFSSKGHDAPGLYSLLIGLGKLDFELLHKLRRINGLPGHPDVKTPGMVTNTGSLGMGISKAKGFIHAANRDKKESELIVLTGDGELQEGQIWESLASAANFNMSNLIAIVDHNKVQSDTYVQTVSDLGNIEQKFQAFGWAAMTIDGHEFESIEQGFNFARTSGRPTALIANTIKGKGVSFMEHHSMDDWRYRYHSGAPSDEDYKKAADELINSINKNLDVLGFDVVVTRNKEYKRKAAPKSVENLIELYSKNLYREVQKDKRIIALDADLVLDTGLIPIRQDYPEQFIECGIAEMDMVSQAGTLALSGYLPVVHSFACFLTPRANEQIYNNSTERTKIIYTGSLAGLLPSGPGHSHQSVRDIGILSSIPNLTLFQPGNEKDVSFIMDWAINKNNFSTYIRLTSIPIERKYSVPDQTEITYGKGYEIFSGTEVCIMAYGAVMLNQAVQAAKLCQEKTGQSVRVINQPWLNAVDDNWLKSIAESSKKLVIVDDHYIKGGLGEFISSQLVRIGCANGLEVKCLGLTEVPECGASDEVLDYHGLSASKICESLL